jgi:hypothetical protein
VFTAIQRKWDPHTIDSFASMENTHLPRYNARWRDPKCEDVDIPTSPTLPGGAKKKKKMFTTIPSERLPSLGALVIMPIDVLFDRRIYAVNPLIPTSPMAITTTSNSWPQTVIVYTSMTNYLSLVSTMRALLQPLRGRQSAKLVSMRSSRRAYLAFALVRLRPCRSWGGNAGETPSRTCRRRPDPRAPPFEIVAAPPIASLLLA